MVLNKEISGTRVKTSAINDVSAFTVPILPDIKDNKTIIASNIINSLKTVINRDSAESIPLFIEIKEGFIEKLAQKIVKSPKKTIVIGVAGESASGKTTFANNCVKACKTRKLLVKPEIYTVMRCDDYFRDASKELKEAGSYEALFASGFSFDVPEAVDLDLLKAHTELLISGKPVKSPEYSFVTCESKQNGETKTPAKIIMIEGLFALNHRLIDLLDIAIYVHTPFEVIKDRWYKRAITRGKTGKAANMQFFCANRDAEMHVRPTMKKADIIVNGVTSAEYIEFIADEMHSAVNYALKA
jgi:uridine kinase